MDQKKETYDTKISLDHYFKEINKIALLSNLGIVILSGNFIFFVTNGGGFFVATLFWGMALIFVLDYFRKNSKKTKIINLTVKSKEAYTGNSPSPDSNFYINGVNSDGKLQRYSCYEIVFDKYKEGENYSFLLDATNSIVNDLDDLSKPNNDIDKEIKLKGKISRIVFGLALITSLTLLINI